MKTSDVIFNVLGNVDRFKPSQKKAPVVVIKELTKSISIESDFDIRGQQVDTIIDEDV